MLIWYLINSTSHYGAHLPVFTCWLIATTLYYLLKTTIIFPPLIYTTILKQPKMSAPIIYNDSMLESELPTASPHVKLETIDELSCHLPTTGMKDSSLSVNQDSSPIIVHSEVLDSVFSTNLDDNDQLLGNTPMFDELDFTLDGTKVNSKDDWVSLFKDEPIPEHAASAPSVPEQDEDLHNLFAEEFEDTFQFAPVKSTKSQQPVKQLETPSTPALSTPVIRDTLAVDSANRVSKKAKVDHLGCVSYSKKQRSQPLKPVAVHSEYPVLLKRARNTEAARRSRARKMERMNQLEAKVEELLEGKKELADEVNRLKNILSAHNIPF